MGFANPPVSYPQNTYGNPIVDRILGQKILDGKAYITPHRIENLANGSSESIYFSNPSDSGKRIHIIAIIVSSLAQAFLDIYKNPSVTANGTQLTPVNLNLSVNTPSAVYIECGGTYDISSADKIYEDVIPGGKKNKAVGVLAELGENIVLPAGTSFLITLTNNSGAASSYAVHIIHYEEEV